MSAPKLLTIAAAAEALGVRSENHVYNLIAAGVLPVVDIRTPGTRKSKSRIDEADLLAYIEANKRTAC